MSLDLGWPISRNLSVHTISEVPDELLGGYLVKGGRQANVHADLAAVRDDGVAHTAVDGRDGQPRRQPKELIDRAGPLVLRQNNDELGGLLGSIDLVRPVPPSAGVARCAVHDNVGTPEPTTADDHMVKTGVADHHPGNRARGLGKIALDTTESAGVLIDV